MFDDALGMAKRCTEDFRDGVRDSFGLSIVTDVLGPILQNLIQQRGANLILDKNAVVFANNSAFDITQPAIDQLNQKMSSLKVTLGAPPAAPK